LITRQKKEGFDHVSWDFLKAILEKMGFLAGEEDRGFLAFLPFASRSLSLVKTHVSFLVREASPK